LPQIEIFPDLGDLGVGFRGQVSHFPLGLF